MEKFLIFVRAVGEAVITKTVGVITVMLRDREVTVSKLEDGTTGLRVDLPVLGFVEFWICKDSNTLGVHTKGFTPSRTETGPYRTKVVIDNNVTITAKRFDGDNLMLLITLSPRPNEGDPKDYVQLAYSDDRCDIEP